MGGGMGGVLVEPEPLGSRGRLLVGLNLAALVGLWLLPLYWLPYLPEVVAVHFGLSGQPDRYGPPGELLLVPAAFSLAPIIILLVTGYRFHLVNRRPYLLNLPAFYLYLPRLPEARRSYWLNRYFESILALSLALGIELLLLEAVIFASAASGQLSPWAFLPLLLTPLLVVGFLAYLSRLSNELKREAGGGPGRI